MNTKNLLKNAYKSAFFAFLLIFATSCAQKITINEVNIECITEDSPKISDGSDQEAMNAYLKRVNDCINGKIN